MVRAPIAPLTFGERKDAFDTPFGLLDRSGPAITSALGPSGPGNTTPLGAWPSSDQLSLGGLDQSGDGRTMPQKPEAAQPSVAGAPPPQPPSGDQTALPQEATSTQGPLSQRQRPSLSTASPSPRPAEADRPAEPGSMRTAQLPADDSSSAGDRLMNGFKGFVGNLHNGLGTALFGGLGALVTGERTDPGGIDARANNATAKALLAKGASPEDVAAAIRSPDVLQQLINRYYGKERFTASTIGRNSDGQPIYGAFDTQTGEARPFPFGTGRMPSGAPANGAPAPNSAPPQSGRAAGATALPSQSANGRPQDSVVAATIANAKAAIAAHPEIRGAVIARLRAYGIDTSGI